MKYKVKKLTTLIMIFALILVPCVNVHAERINTPTLEEFGDPISVKTYEESGCVITEKIYFLPDSSTRDKSGSGTYRNEKEKRWTNGTISTYYAQGHFKWGDGNVSVSNAVGNINNIPGDCSVSDKSVSSGTGKYGYFFNNYAYVTFSCKTTSMVGIHENLSVTIRISESGNAI